MTWSTHDHSTSRCRLVFRTPEEKNDPAKSWARSDEDFFLAGACHILAGVFLEIYRDCGFYPMMLQPAEGFSGTHVVVTDGRRLFDARGWDKYERFVSRYTESWRQLSPAWSCTIAVVSDPLSWEFCCAHRHRHASQFFEDPVPRAQAFLRQFAAPS